MRLIIINIYFKFMQLSWQYKNVPDSLPPSLPPRTFVILPPPLPPLLPICVQLSWSRDALPPQMTLYCKWIGNLLSLKDKEPSSRTKFLMVRWFASFINPIRWPAMIPNLRTLSSCLMIVLPPTFIVITLARCSEMYSMVWLALSSTESSFLFQTPSYNIP